MMPLCMDIYSFGDLSMVKFTLNYLLQELKIPSTSDLERRGENDQKDASNAQESQRRLKPKTKRVDNSCEK